MSTCDSLIAYCRATKDHLVSGGPFKRTSYSLTFVSFPSCCRCLRFGDLWGDMRILTLDRNRAAWQAAQSSETPSSLHRGHRAIICAFCTTTRSRFPFSLSLVYSSASHRCLVGSVLFAVSGGFHQHICTKALVLVGLVDQCGPDLHTDLQEESCSVWLYKYLLGHARALLSRTVNRYLAFTHGCDSSVQGTSSQALDRPMSRVSQRSVEHADP
jgi:hypothetical protein